ncbi:hypothetical protein D3C72_1042870 [compost metagenome]
MPNRRNVGRKRALLAMMAAPTSCGSCMPRMAMTGIRLSAQVASVWRATNKGRIADCEKNTAAVITQTPSPTLRA